MLLVGRVNILNIVIQNIPNLFVYNLSSLLEGPVKLNIAPPYNISFDERTLDIEYAKYLMMDDNAFISLMEFMFHIYNGENVLILIGDDDIHEYAIESLQKFIQQRYGILSYNIQSEEDIHGLTDLSIFNLNGVYNFDLDKKRYIDLMISRGMVKL